MPPNPQSDRLSDRSITGEGPVQSHRSGGGHGLWMRLIRWALANGHDYGLGVYESHLGGPNAGKIMARVGPITAYGRTSNEAFNNLADGLIELGWKDDR